MEHYVIDIIKSKLEANGGKAEIPLLRGIKYFIVVLDNGGVNVSNLATQPFLPWEVFIKTVDLLDRKGGEAIKGSAQSGKLGDKGLELDTIEGYIASEVYRKELGESVFRRITPICNILVWAGICENGRGYLVKINHKN